MDNSYIFQILGMTGSLIMCTSSIPQIIKTYRTKCTDGLSGLYIAILMAGMTLIMLYALSVKDAVFILSNGLSLMLTGILAGLWFKYRQQ